MRKLTILITFLGVFTGSVLASAKSDFPNRPIELIIPYAPGGGMDLLARLFNEKVGQKLGQPVILTFKVGAGGAIGTAFVAKSKADGYTLLLGSNTGMIIAPLTKKGMGYELNDFAPICNLQSSPLMWCVKEDSPYKKMQDLTQTAKTKKIKYSSYGALSMAHICMEAIGRAAGFEATHIPYAGSSLAMAAVLGGHVEASVTAGVGGMVGPGRLRILAVSSEKRFKTFPDLPTLMELGYPISVLATYYVWAPKGTPEDRIIKIYEAFKKVANENEKEISEALNRAEMNLHLLGPEDLRKFAHADYTLQKRMIEEMGALIK